MAIMITDECINCGACEPECPNNAIYEGGAQWRWADGTSLKEAALADGTVESGTAPHTPVSDEYYDRAPFRFDGHIDRVHVAYT